MMKIIAIATIMISAQSFAESTNLIPKVVYPQIKHYPSGAIEQIKHYNFETQTGVTTGYYGTGEVLWVTPWKSGKRHGEYREYDRQGDLITKHEYVDGVRKRNPIAKGITRAINGVQNFFCGLFGPGD